MSPDVDESEISYLFWSSLNTWASFLSRGSMTAEVVPITEYPRHIELVPRERALYDREHKLKDCCYYLHSLIVSRVMMLGHTRLYKWQEIALNIDTLKSL
jgi:hypothetical protein